MPSEEDPHLPEEFIAIRALLTVVSQRICGRASIVWEVVKKKDYERHQGDLGQFPVRVPNLTWFAITEPLLGICIEAGLAACRQGGGSERWSI